MTPAHRTREFIRAAAVAYNSATPIELRHLRYILAAVDHGSFRQAALTLNIRASTLSRRIGDLEGWLGVRIFVRHHGGISLTAEGERLARRARVVMDRVEWMLTSVNCGRGSITADYEMRLRIRAAPDRKRNQECPKTSGSGFVEANPQSLRLDGVLTEHQWLVISKALSFDRNRTRQLLAAAIYGAACRTLSENRRERDEGETWLPK